MKNPVWFVSRQMYWPDGKRFVEIARGGLDFANPDMLGIKYRYLGEGREFNNPREAVEAGLAIRDAWAKDSGEQIEIGHGYTGGCTLYFDGVGDEELKKWADLMYDKVEKCGHCGDVLGDQRFGHFDIGEYDCCSSYCAEERWAT